MFRCPWGSLRLRLSLSIVGIVLTVALVSMVVDYVREYRTHRQDTISSLAEQAHALQLARMNLPDEQSFAGYVNEFCAQVNENISPGHHVLVVNPEGGILASTRHHSGAEVEHALLTAGPSDAILSVDGRGLAQARLADDEGYTIIVAQYLDHMQRILRGQLISRAVSVGVAATAIIALVFVTMSRWVLEPISHLQAAIKAWSDRRFSVRSKVTGPADIRILASEFNVMAERIERYEAERGRAEEERLRLEARIQHAQKLESLGVLAGGVAHDFNNILTAVLGHADLALLELPMESPARDSMEAVKDSAIRAAEISKQMLAYSGKGHFVVEAANLTDVVGAMRPLLATSVSKDVELTFELSDELLPIEGDLPQLRQAVMNLVTNASEALGDDAGRIVVSTENIMASRQYLTEAHLGEGLPEGPYVALAVSDTGSGMTEEVMSRAFEPFFTTKFPGRGLGLAVVQGIVRGHRGAIKISSGPGSGTRVMIILPAANAAACTADTDGPNEALRCRAERL